MKAIGWLWWEKNIKMKQSHFFVPPEQMKNGLVYLSATDAVHVAKVLRLNAGDKIVLSDGAGKAYLAVLEQAEPKCVSCIIEKELAGLPRQGPKVTLVQGIPKSEKMDLIIQKGVELGLHGLIPLLSERVVVKLTEEKQVKRWERWQRIALEAAKQCRRADLPEVSRPKNLPQVLADLPPEAVVLLPWEEETAVSLKVFLKRYSRTPATVYFFIGPEGGFSPAEVEMARLHGVCPVTLGPRILRTETAGLAVAAMLLYQWGDLGG